MADKQNVFTTYQISRICGVAMQTVIEWEKQGKLPAYRTLGGHRRITKADLAEFLRKNKLPVPDGLIEESGNRVLVVDDDKYIIRLVYKIIKKYYPECILSCAMDGYEAGRQVLTFKPDLVILDLKLPGVDGFEVCRKIKSGPQTKNIRILAITGFPSKKAEKHILSCGADAYLTKPFDNEEFARNIKELLP